MYSYDKFDEEERIEIYKSKVNKNNNNNKLIFSIYR